jgi:hypothetical protein
VPYSSHSSDGLRARIDVYMVLNVCTRRAHMLSTLLNSLEGVTCNAPEGVRVQRVCCC